MNESRPEQNSKASQKQEKQGEKLHCAAEAVAYQKDWFKMTRETISRGEPFAIAQADTPHEIFLTMDIPVVPVQWWSAMISAKQMSPYYFDRMNEFGYPQSLCRYCSLPFACTLDHNPEKAPWGGLPTPTILFAELTCDSHPRIFELWAKEYGCDFFPLEHTGAVKPFGKWWQNIKSDWDEVVEPHRIDLRTRELENLISHLETTTGRIFDREKFIRVMELVNEQEDYFTKTRNLIAATSPSPVSLPDQISATMNPQWHRGTEWGAKQAKLFYNETQERVNKGYAACPEEKTRLMWIGAGLWHNTAFYRHFEEQYGATFVCSIYLSIAADGYAREIKGNPMGALASRHLDMSDYLRQPEWLIKEARLHNAAGAVMIISKSCIRDIGRRFIALAFEAAGIPILPIYADVVDMREWDDEKIKNQVSEFIEKRILKGRTG